MKKQSIMPKILNIIIIKVLVKRMIRVKLIGALILQILKLDQLAYMFLVL